MSNVDNRPKINIEENVLLYEIEKNDFYTDPEDPEIVKELNEHNDAYLANVVEPMVFRTFEICRCQMQEFMARNENRRRLLNVDPRAYQPTIEQADVDKYKFAVIILSTDGKYDGVSAIVRECKACHKIDLWGDIRVYSRMIAEITNNFLSNYEEGSEVDDVEATEGNPLGEDCIFEDLETGVLSDANGNAVETETLGEIEDRPKVLQFPSAVDAESTDESPSPFEMEEVKDSKDTEE